ncbi:MAG: hypothetical protein ACHQE5_01185 [Actinomycetes bacterium]
MLDLGVATRIVAGVTLAGDDQDPFAFHVLPPPPRVASADGTPQLTLLRFVDQGQLKGGHLQLQTELSYSDAQLEPVRQQLALGLTNDRDRARISLHPVTVTGGSAELVFVGQETQPDGGVTALLQRSYGTATPNFDPPYATAFSVLLTPEGVSLVEAALRTGGAPVGVIYRLQVEGLRPALRILAHVDWGRVYDQLSSDFRQGFLFFTEDVQKVSEKLVESKAVSIRVVQGLVDPAGAPADLAPALAWIEREVVERFCQAVTPLSREPARVSLGDVSEILGVGSGYVLKQLDQPDRDAIDLDFQRQAVVARTLTCQAHLADLLQGASPDQHIADAAPDHPFFAKMWLHVRTARPLAETFVREVIAHFSYGTTDTPLQLTPPAPEGRAGTWADQSPTRTWSLPLDVTFADDSPVDPGVQVHLDGPSGQTRELTLDLESLLGLRRIDVAGSADARVSGTRVDVAQYRGQDAQGDPRGLMLLPGQPPAPAFFRDVRPGDRIVATVKYLLQDGRIVELAPLTVDTRALRLPPPFPGAMTVQVFADDDWSDLRQVVVVLQKSPDLAAGTFVIDKPGTALVVDVDMPDPADRSYRYKVTRIRASGVTEEDDWVQSDASALFVGASAGKLVVDVTPVGVELPVAGISSIEVDLQYVDAEHLVRDVQTAVIRALADRFHWEVALKDPARRTYDYRVTIDRNTGQRQVGPWTTSSDRILTIPVSRA